MDTYNAALARDVISKVLLDLSTAEEYVAQAVKKDNKDEEQAILMDFRTAVINLRGVHDRMLST